MCIQSRGMLSYARALIEVQSDVELKDNIVVAMPKLIGKGFYMCNVHVEYEWKPPRYMCCKVSKMNNVTSGNKKKDVKPTIEWILVLDVHSSSTSTTPIIEKIDKMERLIIDGTANLVDDEGKPLTRLDSSGDHDSKDEVASVDNDIANFLASKDVGYGTNSLLE
ncbi:hypothetical protein Tco_1149451 [Tanacetum coccineum]